MIMYIPKLSTIAVEADIRRRKAKAAQFNEPPREAWLLECVQEDRNNPLPCTEQKTKKWGTGQDVGRGAAESRHARHARGSRTGRAARRRRHCHDEDEAAQGNDGRRRRRRPPGDAGDAGAGDAGAAKDKATAEDGSTKKSCSKR